MNAPGGPFSRGKVSGGPLNAYSPLQRPAYNEGSFDRVLTAAERVAPPKGETPGSEMRPIRDEFSGFSEDLQRDEGETRETEANQRFAEIPTWPPVESGGGAANKGPITAGSGPPSPPPDAEILAGKLDQMGIRLSVSGLSVANTLPTTSASTIAATASSYSTASEAAKAQPEGPTSAQTETTESAPHQSVEAAGASDNADSGQPSPEHSDTPGEQGGSAFSGQFGAQLGAAAFATLSDEAVAAVDAASAVENLAPVHVPDGITVRVVDPEGAWEVDVMRTGTDLALILRGSQEVTDGVLRDESTLRNDLAREGWRLSHLRVEPNNETPQAVRATSGAESTQTSTNMQSDHSGAQARHEEAPPWQSPRGDRPAPRALGTPTISATGRLDREI